MKKGLKTLLFLLTSTILVILPDLLFKIFQNSEVEFKIGKIIEIFIFTSLIMLIKQRKLRRFFIYLYGIFYTMELCHLAFFGAPATPYTYIWMFSELEDTATGILKSVNLIYAPISVIIPFILLLYIDKKYDKEIQRYKVIGILYICIIIFMAIDVNRPNRSFFYMSERASNPTFIASIRKIPFIIFKATPKAIFGGKRKEFKEYILKEITAPKKVNIIYIFGESGNPKYMSLYGYKNDTTPNLNKYKNDKYFYYKKGYSSSVSTIYSVMMNFYMQREPENYKIQEDKKTDIVQLAKNKDFKIWYITTQSTDPKYENIVDSYKNISSELKNGEEIIIDYLPKTEELKDKNMIIYHQNIMHYDYKDQYAFNKEKWEVFKAKDNELNNEKIAEYSNAVLYWDYITNKIFDYAKELSEKTKSPTYVIYMSDHGELIGGNKRGHSLLTEEVGTIPIFIKCFNCREKEFQIFKEIKTPTHYRVNEKLLNLIGYKLINPNDDGKTFYINGKSFYGDDGFITLTD